MTAAGANGADALHEISDSEDVDDSDDADGMGSLEAPPVREDDDDTSDEAADSTVAASPDSAAGSSSGEDEPTTTRRLHFDPLVVSLDRFLETKWPNWGALQHIPTHMELYDLRMTHMGGAERHLKECAKDAYRDGYRVRGPLGELQTVLNATDCALRRMNRLPFGGARVAKSAASIVPLSPAATKAGATNGNDGDSGVLQHGRLVGRGHSLQAAAEKVMARGWRRTGLAPLIRSMGNSAGGSEVDSAMGPCMDFRTNMLKLPRCIV